MDCVTCRPLPLDRQILPRLCSSNYFSVHADLCAVGPSRDTQIEGKSRSLRRSDGNLDFAIPRIICFLRDLQANPVFQPPVQFRIVVQVKIDSIAAGAVEVSWQGSESTLEIRRTTSGVVPGIANLLSGGRVKRQWIPIAIKCSVERHSGIDAVIQRPF